MMARGVKVRLAMLVVALLVLPSPVSAPVVLSYTLVGVIVARIDLVGRQQRSDAPTARLGQLHLPQDGAFTLVTLGLLCFPTGKSLQTLLLTSKHCLQI